MTPFEVAEPRSLAEAVALLTPDDPTVRPLSGGTALMLMMKARVFRPTTLVSLRKIEQQYSTIAADAKGLSIGAMTTLGSMARSEQVQRSAPLISRTLVTLSNVRVRNVATVGGALAHGDPHMDLPPVLIALGAAITIVGPSGSREIELEDLFSGYYETTLKHDELIAQVRIPAQGQKKGFYAKVTTGSADDWPALGIAVVIDVDGNRAKSARLVMSAATDKATRLRQAEAVISGAEITDGVLADTAEAALQECEFIADLRGSIAYKRDLARVHLRRAVRQALNSSGVQS